MIKIYNFTNDLLQKCLILTKWMIPPCYFYVNKVNVNNKLKVEESSLSMRLFSFCRMFVLSRHAKISDAQ